MMRSGGTLRALTQQITLGAIDAVGGRGGVPLLAHALRGGQEYVVQHLAQFGSKVGRRHGAGASARQTGSVLLVIPTHQYTTLEGRVDYARKSSFTSQGTKLDSALAQVIDATTNSNPSCTSNRTIVVSASPNADAVDVL
jgi:hypothetical protein